MVNLIFVCKSSGQEKRIEDQTVVQKEEKCVTQKYKIEHERKKKEENKKWDDGATSKLRDTPRTQKKAFINI